MWLGMRSKLSRGCMVAGQVVFLYLKSHFSMLRRSYVMPVAIVTGFSIISKEMGHLNMDGSSNSTGEVMFDLPPVAG